LWSFCIAVGLTLLIFAVEIQYNLSVFETASQTTNPKYAYEYDYYVPYEFCAKYII